MCSVAERTEQKQCIHDTSRLHLAQWMVWPKNWRVATTRKGGYTKGSAGLSIFFIRDRPFIAIALSVFQVHCSKLRLSCLGSCLGGIRRVLMVQPGCSMAPMAAFC